MFNSGDGKGLTIEWNSNNRYLIYFIFVLKKIGSRRD